uniref:Pogo transposable element derived with ZNF domain n=1 Tax=Callorhinchus milii TaxID=7868 RepID=A0A4W3H5C8_CALMI
MSCSSGIIMADTDLFMECEEEELEPWQRIEDDVVDDTGAEATPSSTNHFSSGVKRGFVPVSVSDVHSTEPAKKTLLTVLSSNNVGASVMGSGRQPLIMTQSSSSLGSMTVSPMYQPTTVQVLQDPKTGTTSTVSGQPILITTQVRAHRFPRPRSPPSPPLPPSPPSNSPPHSPLCPFGPLPLTQLACQPGSVKNLTAQKEAIRPTVDYYYLYYLCLCGYQLVPPPCPF